MTTFARVIDGSTVDCQVAANQAELAKRFHPDWLARNPFIQVPDGTQASAKDNLDGTFTNPPVFASSQPNNAGNPYFGKTPLQTKDFWALVGQILPPDRFKRLLNDSHFLWVNKVLDNVALVDVDDKAGQFLQVQTYLVSTNGDDAALLMTKAERDAIMAAWK